MQGIKGIGRSPAIKKSGTSKSRKKTSVSMGGETVRLASADHLREQAKAMLAEMPDVRLERIEEIRGALEQGRYRVKAKQVAKRIVANALAEGPWQY